MQVNETGMLADKTGKKTSNCNQDKSHWEDVWAKPPRTGMCLREETAYAKAVGRESTHYALGSIRKQGKWRTEKKGYRKTWKRGPEIGWLRIGDLNMRKDTDLGFQFVSDCLWWIAPHAHCLWPKQSTDTNQWVNGWRTQEFVGTWSTIMSWKAQQLPWE